MTVSRARQRLDQAGSSAEHRACSVEKLDGADGKVQAGEQTARDAFDWVVAEGKQSIYDLGAQHPVPRLG
uniref:Uncharacterized protein n=1 Tax=Thermogemmatispora argillosa TaxID=2045280 RepID=A0A455T461_9CHLR|nr:hypothetical protein KTA_14740 [Thermogemmatispora argillosa]